MSDSRRTIKDNARPNVVEIPVGGYGIISLDRVGGVVWLHLLDNDGFSGESWVLDHNERCDLIVGLQSV